MKERNDFDIHDANTPHNVVQLLGSMQYKHQVLVGLEPLLCMEATEDVSHGTPSSMCELYLIKFFLPSQGWALE